KKHGRMMLESIDNGPLVSPTVEENRQTRPKKYSKLTETQQLQDDCDVQATNIILHGFPPDVVIAKEHVVISVIDDEETLILEEESQSKMLDKQNDPISIEKKIKISPIDYSKLNKIKEDFGKRFVTQKELYAEQVFWLKHLSFSETLVTSHTPVRIEAPSELPKSQEKDTVIIKLKDRIKSLSGKDSLENVKKGIDETETINIELEHNSDLNAQLQEKVFTITTLINELRKLKGKNVVDTADSKPNVTNAPGMFKLDIEPIFHRLKNNRDAHGVYIGKTIENTDTLRLKPTTSASGSKPSGNTKNNRITRPPSSNQKNKVEDHSRKVKSSFVSLKKSNKNVVGRTFSIVRNSCPLTRITSTKVVPPKETTISPVVTPTSGILVYSRRPKATRCVGSSSKVKIVEYKISNSKEPKQSWGSTVFDVPSPSLKKRCTIKKYFINTSRNTIPSYSLDVEEANHDIKVAHMDNNPFVDFLIPEPSYEESSTQVVILNHVHSINQPPEHINKWTKYHPIDNVICDPSRPVSTQQQLQDEALLCYFDSFLSSVDPKSYKDALTESYWIEAMQEKLNEFEHLEVWELVPRLDRVMGITLKWICKVKLDELGGVLKNMARLIARYYRQEEGIDFKESFALISRLEAMRIFIAFASHINMVVYQMDVKITFLNGILREEVYKFTKGTVDLTLFVRHVNDGQTIIFLNQSKYALELIKKYGMETCEPADTPMVEKSKLDEDPHGKAVDPTRYYGMIGTLIYLTASRPDLVFAVCMCA
nr:hypothetical protein [Tanacetum cinerariifolium]